jgi:hypothetical protein
MFRTFTAFAAAAALFGASAAFAADGPAYPLSVTQGENSVIEFGPGNPRGTLVGGGRVETRTIGNNTETRHLDPNFVQSGATGLVAVSIGSGENSSVVFVPANEALRLGQLGAATRG